MIGLDLIFGGITGLVGNVITSVTNYKTMKLKNEHDEKMIELNTSAMIEKSKMQIIVTKNKIAGEVELAELGAYTKSQEVGNQKTFSEKWIENLLSTEGRTKVIAIPFGILFCTLFSIVDFLRGFMRPALTIYLTVLTTIITYMSWEILQKNGVETIQLKDAISLFDRVISIVIYLTVSCVTWWFADRQTAKFLYKLNNKNARDITEE